MINAAREGHLGDVKDIVDAGVPANSQDGEALIRAAREGHYAVVQYLVEQAGVRADIRNSRALNEAHWNRQLEVVRYLVEGAPEDLRIKKFALHMMDFCMLLSILLRMCIFQHAVKMDKL